MICPSGQGTKIIPAYCKYRVIGEGIEYGASFPGSPEPARNAGSECAGSARAVLWDTCPAGIPETK
jgi:hypothetical protein